MATRKSSDLAAEARTVCDIVRTTLGPFGATKLLVEGDGTVTTTTAGTAVLDALDVDSPAVTLLRRAAADFEAGHRDGTSTAVALVGALLEEADHLRELGVHPTVVERGYHEALDAALGRLDDRARPLSLVGTDAVARTALTGTRDPNARERVGEQLAAVADAIADDAGSDRSFDPDAVAVLARVGGRARTELLRGVLLEREPVADGMARTAEDAGVAVLSSTVDVPTFGTETDRRRAGVSLDAASFDERAALRDREREAFREQLREAVELGCRFVATERAVNERVETTLANHGVLALQRVDEGDIVRLARATGASVVPGLGALTADALGRADVGVVRKAGRDLTVVESDAGEPTYSLLCRAPDPRSVDAFRRSVEGALAAVADAERTGRVVPGGGAIETNAARAVRDRARSVGSREQLAVEAFADALLTVPRALATNAGMDGWDAIVRLHAAHGDHRDAVGVDALAGATADVLDGEPIVDPVGLKRESWTAATELAVKLARIDAELPATDLGSDDESPRSDESSRAR